MSGKDGEKENRKETALVVQATQSTQVYVSLTIEVSWSRWKQLYAQTLKRQQMLFNVN